MAGEARLESRRWAEGALRGGLAVASRTAGSPAWHHDPHSTGGIDSREGYTTPLGDSRRGLLDSDQEARLDQILEVADGARASTLECLRKGPRRISGQQMRVAPERVSEIARLGFVGFDTSAVLPRRVIELARYGLSGKTTLIRRHPRDRRLATLLAAVSSLHMRAVDDALDLFDVLMATKLLSKATQTSDKERLHRFPRLVTASSQLARAVEVLLECVESEPDAPLEEAWRKIQEAVDRNDLVSAVSRVSELAPSPDSDLDEIWRTELVKKFPDGPPFPGLANRNGRASPLIPLIRPLMAPFSTKEGAIVRH